MSESDKTQEVIEKVIKDNTDSKEFLTWEETIADGDKKLEEEFMEE